MDKPTLTFGELREILSGLGFEETVVPKEFVAFRHEASDTDFLLPFYRLNQIVAPHHLAMFRMQLDAKGILDADEFNRRLADEAVRHPA